MIIKCGNGFDIHKFSPNRKLIIGGVEVPYFLGLDGHSDADVLIHAIIDSYISVALGKDIGNLFPDSNNDYKDIDSKILLKRSYELLKDSGYQISHNDSTIIAEAPKMTPHIPTMRKVLSNILELNIDQITIKATTSEKLGFIGRGEGIAVMSISTLIKS